MSGELREVTEAERLGLSSLQWEDVPRAPGSHTPGPWHYSRCELGHPDNWKNPMITVHGRATAYVARVGWQGSTAPGMTSRTPETFEEAEANARLIASAPDLLAACESALSVLRIADNCPHQNYELREIETCKSILRAAISKALGPDSGPSNCEEETNA